MAYMRDVTGTRLDSFEVADAAYTVAIPGTRVAVAPLTGPNGTTTLGSNIDLTLRTIMSFAFETKRWRLKIRNRDLLATAIPSGSATITSVQAGTPSRPTSSSSGARWVGACTGALTSLHSSPLTVPGDGSWVYSPWFSDPGQQFAPNAEKVISLGLTASSGAVLAKGNSYQWAQGNGSANAGAATLTSPVVGHDRSYFDVCVEYEFDEAIRVVVAIGDSNTLGYSPGSPPLLPSASPGILPAEAWPNLAASMGGFACINLGVGSAQTPNFDPTAVSYVPALWDRLPAGVVIDAAINSLGTNDLASSLNSWLTQVQGINAYERNTLGIKNVWWTSITQRCYPDGSYGPTVDSGAIKAGYLQANIAAGATSFTSANAIPTGTVLLGAGGVTAEDVTVSSVSGSGPYTATLAAGVANAHYVGERWGFSQERLRAYKNNFLRNLPDGITGLYDFERALESTPGSYQLDARYAAADWLHFQRGASSIKASMIIGAGVQPLFA